jgi:hypothetical protein
MAALLPYRIGKRKAKKNPKRRMGLVEMRRAFGRQALQSLAVKHAWPPAVMTWRR